MSVNLVDRSYTLGGKTIFNEASKLAIQRNLSLGNRKRLRFDTMCLNYDRYPDNPRVSLSLEHILELFASYESARPFFGQLSLLRASFCIDPFKNYVAFTIPFLYRSETAAFIRELSHDASNMIGDSGSGSPGSCVLSLLISDFKGHCNLYINNIMLVPWAHDPTERKMNDEPITLEDAREMSILDALYIVDMDTRAQVRYPNKALRLDPNSPSVVTVSAMGKVENIINEEVGAVALISAVDADLTANLDFLDDV